MDRGTIASAAELCRNEFIVLLESDPLRHQADKADFADAIEEEQARFRVWAAHIGTFATYHSSLDYRLRESEKVRSLVISQLEVLRRAEVQLLKLLQPSKSQSFHVATGSNNYKILKIFSHCTEMIIQTSLLPLLKARKNQFQIRNP